MTAQRNLAWPVYYSGQLASCGGAPSEVCLEGEEARHAAVRRHRPGEWIVVTAGQGGWVAGPVTEVHGRSGLTLSVELAGEQAVVEPSITVVQALPKSDRADEAVELLTAVGVDRIVPWQAERSVARWSPERIERGLGRWQRTAAEAAKQSRRVRWPIISAPVGGRELLDLLSAAPIALMCHEQAKVAIGSVPLDAADPEIVVVIGPEGGICAAELAAMAQAGAIAVSLGPTVLRTSVAGGLAAALVMSRVGRLAAADALADHPVQRRAGRVGAPDGPGAP